jgi:putative ABC transport system permease protein
MIFSTLIIYRQMRYFHEKDLGFDKEQLIAVTMYENMWQHYPALLNDIRKNKSIADYAVASTLPGQRFSMQHFAPLSAATDPDLGSRAMWGDERLLPTLGVPLVAGRNFFPQFPEIKKPEFIVNEAAVKALQLKDPIGKRFVLDTDTGEVVGVMKDFNFASLHSAIEPMVIQYNPFRANYLLLKVRPDRFRQTLQFLESDIKLLSPASVFSYTFIDEKLNRLYESENRMSTVFKVFAGFALFISCLGLLGLSAYSARIRIKEVGIRKLLGASVSNVTLLLSRDFLKLVLLATLIAWPLGWWAMSYWLHGFAYHINIGIATFAISGMAAFLVGLLTVSSQAVKAAVGNPVDSLRSE